MIEYYRWQKPSESTFYFFVIKPTRKRDDVRYQYLGWFYKSKINELYFDTRLNHSARPNSLKNVDLNLDGKHLRQMFKDIFKYDPNNI